MVTRRTENHEGAGGSCHDKRLAQQQEGAKTTEDCEACAENPTGPHPHLRPHIIQPKTIKQSNYYLK